LFFCFFCSRSVLGGLKFELEEIEAKRDEPDYVHTIAFLNLFYKLLCSGKRQSGEEREIKKKEERLFSFSPSLIPSDIPQNDRILPFLLFSCYNVFLGFDERRYRIHTRKWVVAKCCLRIIRKVSKKVLVDMT
jgi:hypothetical protein